MREPTWHLYFHSPCFDGIVSAVLLSDFLTTARSVEDITLHVVNYHLRGTWKDLRLEQPSAVIDFLYHPEAMIWFDHHLTTFLDRELQASYECRKGPEIVYEGVLGRTDRCGPLRVARRGDEPLTTVEPAINWFDGCPGNTEAKLARKAFLPIGLVSDGRRPLSARPPRRRLAGSAAGGSGRRAAATAVVAASAARNQA